MKFVCWKFVLQWNANGLLCHICWGNHVLRHNFIGIHGLSNWVVGLPSVSQGLKILDSQFYAEVIKALWIVARSLAGWLAPAAECSSLQINTGWIEAKVVFLANLLQHCCWLEQAGRPTNLRTAKTRLPCGNEVWHRIRPSFAYWNLSTHVEFWLRALWIQTWFCGSPGVWYRLRFLAQG